MKSALTRSTATASKEAPITPKGLSERLSNALLGVKGSSLTRTYDFEENPMTRLKLLLVRRFCPHLYHVLTVGAGPLPRSHHS